ncbi:MAG: tyrosine-type recombinase/integrase [Fimbriiglobus sp.]
MSRRKSATSPRFRVGKVTVYEHHTAWWVYYRSEGKNVRRKVGATRAEAEQVASTINAQLANNEPTLLAFSPITVSELRKQFLNYHELVLHSSIGTVRRYRAATQHLENFILTKPKPPMAHDVKPDLFVAYLRGLEVAPNGHANTTKRKLRTKGVKYILETCRSLYQYALKQRNLPPYVGNPFSELPLDRFKLEDVKPIFVFTAKSELAFLRAASDWAFSIHFTLAKTGLRIGELTHLLIEDLDLDNGWLHVRNKTDLGWRIKTGQERLIPLLPEVITVLKGVIGSRTVGPVFLREKIATKRDRVIGDRVELESVLKKRRAAKGTSLNRTEEAQLAQKLWWDAGAIKPDAIRTSFVRLMKKLAITESTCPKSWRHTFATLLQDANVDPLIRQQVMGHRPSISTGLGMTGKYTHTRPETLKSQVLAALRMWPESLEFAAQKQS